MSSAQGQLRAHYMIAPFESSVVPKSAAVIDGGTPVRHGGCGMFEHTSW